MFVRISITNTDTNSKVDNALILGFTCFLVIEYIATERVCDVPPVNKLITKSSSESVNAIKNPLKIPGIISGRTTLKNALKARSR